MTEFATILPENRPINPEELRQRVRQLEVARQELRSFHPDVLNFCEVLARSLRENKEIRSRPALAALAWWLRPGSLVRLREHWESLSSSRSTVRVPRGVVFHVPPTNVETIIIYSWICSALAGNANAIRISTSNSSENQLLFEVLFETLKEFPLISNTTLFVKYGHSKEITEILSETDVRAIWGGDKTVEEIRSIKSSPRSVDLPFSNRFSFSLISAPTIENAPDSELKQFAHDFVNDSYWFDQVACSSPKLIFLLDPEYETDSAVLNRLALFLTDELIEKGVEVSASTSMAKLVNSFALAADGIATRVLRPNHQLTIGEVKNLQDFPRDAPGGGLFYAVRIKNISELLPFVKRTDQTLTHYGIETSQLRELVDLLNGRGVDRIVPVGEALNFDVIWDGFDLLESFSKLVHLKISR